MTRREKNDKMINVEKGYKKYIEIYRKFQKNNTMYSAPFTMREYKQMAKEIRAAGSKNAPRDVASMQRSFTENEAYLIGKALGMRKREVKLFNSLEYEYKGEIKVAKTARQAAFIRAKIAEEDENKFNYATAIYKKNETVNEETYEDWKEKQKALQEAERKARKKRKDKS